MASFVLSGFFIATSVVRSATLQRWSWRDYLVNRCTRLYVVLIPALALTLAWDSFGLYISSDASIYTGEAHSWKNDYFNVADRLTYASMLGNLVFLPTVYVAPYGSNEPLWSLAFEFWYYLLFPICFLGVRYYRSWMAKVVCFLVFGCICLLINSNILLYFPIWLMGATIGFLRPLSLIHKLPTWPTILLAVLFATSMAAAGHLNAIKALFWNSSLAMDYLTGVGFTVLTFVLLHDQRRDKNNLYSRIAKSTAAFYFTLYVTHMPILVFLRAIIAPGRPWAFSTYTAIAASGLTIVAILYAIAIYNLTERHTPSVRSWIAKRLSRRTSLATK